MARTRSLLAVFGLALLATGCGGQPTPAELAGLWSAGPAACAAGVGVRFNAHRIAAVYDRQEETLFEHPRYEIQGAGDDFRVRILYELPHRPGGASVVGAHGVLVLARDPEGGLEARAHSMVDGRTGTVRMRIVDDPAVRAMDLEPCGPHPWREQLRGRGRQSETPPV
jgi:hypothetical protein